MGGGISIDESLKGKAFALVETVKMSEINSTEKEDALKELWDLADTEENVVHMLHPSLDLLPELIIVLKTDSGICKENALGCLWFLTRTESARDIIGLTLSGLSDELIYSLKVDAGICREVVLTCLRNLAISNKISEQLGQKQTGLLEVLDKLNTENPELACSICDITICLSNVVGNIEELLSDTYSFLSFWKQRLTDFPDEIEWYWQLANIASFNLNDKQVDLLLKYGFMEIFVTRLLSNVDDEESYLHGIAKNCMDFLLGITCNANAANALKALNVMSFFTNLTQSHDLIGLKAMCIASTLYSTTSAASNDRNKQSQSSPRVVMDSTQFIVSDKLLDLLFLVIQSILTQNENEGDAVELLNKYGLVHGNIKIRMLLSTLKNLTLQDNYKQLVLTHTPLAPLLQILNAYLSNAPSFGSINSVNIQCGGGGDDRESAEYCVEIMYNLSFCFDDDEKFKSHYFGGEINADNILQQIANLPSSRKLSSTSKLQARTLLRRYMPTQVFESSPSLKAISRDSKE